MKKPTLIIAIIFFIVAALSIVQVLVSNSFSTQGVLLSKLENEIKNYTNENAFLNEKLLLASSLTNIASEASQLGFEKVGSLVLPTSPLPLALKQ